VVPLVKVSHHCHEASSKSGCQVDSDRAYRVFYFRVHLFLLLLLFLFLGLPIFAILNFTFFWLNFDFNFHFNFNVILIRNTIPIGPTDGEYYNEAKSLVTHFRHHELLGGFEDVL